MGTNIPNTNRPDPNRIVRIEHGPGTADTFYVTESGERWLSVGMLPTNRGTADRVGRVVGGRVQE